MNKSHQILLCFQQAAFRPGRFWKCVGGDQPRPCCLQWSLECGRFEGVWALGVSPAEGGAGAAAVLQERTTGLTSVGFNRIGFTKSSLSFHPGHNPAMFYLLRRCYCMWLNSKGTKGVRLPQSKLCTKDILTYRTFVLCDKADSSLYDISLLLKQKILYNLVVKLLTE